MEIHPGDGKAGMDCNGVVHVEAQMGIAIGIDPALSHYRFGRGRGEQMRCS